MAVQPIQVKLRHPLLKGLGVSMLVSVAYMVAFGLAFALDNIAVMPALLFSFIPVFVIVNAVVTGYYREHYTGMSQYAVGAVVAFVLDVGVFVVIVSLLVVLVALGSGGQ